MSVSPASVPVLGEAMHALGREEPDDDARFVARHLEAAGWAIVPADDAPVPSRDGDPEEPS